MTKRLMVSLAVILLLPNLFNIAVFSENGYNLKEEYDPALSYINSLAKLNQHIDSILTKEKMTTGTYDCVFEITSIIRKRFYHGYSHFTLEENWIAAISGKLIDSGMGCKVQPDKILLNQNASCSQQSIVMMALLRNRGISYRHLAFPHHYALEVLIGGKWYFFDPAMEPDMNEEQRSENGWQYHSDSLKKYYSNGGMTDMDYVFGDGLTAQKGKINEIPAPNARIFKQPPEYFQKRFGAFPYSSYSFSRENISKLAKTQSGSLKEGMLIFGSKIIGHLNCRP